MAESRSPTATPSSTERGGRSFSMAMPFHDARELIDQREQLGKNCGLTVGGKEFAAGLFVALAERAKVGLHAGAVAAFGVAHRARAADR